MVFMGLHLPRDPCGGGDHSALHHGRYPVCRCRLDSHHDRCAVEARRAFEARCRDVACDCYHGIFAARARQRTAVFRRANDAVGHCVDHRCHGADLDACDRRALYSQSDRSHELDRSGAWDVRRNSARGHRSRRRSARFCPVAMSRRIFVGGRIGVRAQTRSPRQSARARARDAGRRTDAARRRCNHRRILAISYCEYYRAIDCRLRLARNRRRARRLQRVRLRRSPSSDERDRDVRVHQPDRCGCVGCARSARTDDAKRTDRWCCRRACGRRDS